MIAIRRFVIQILLGYRVDGFDSGQARDLVLESFDQDWPAVLQIIVQQVAKVTNYLGP